MFLKYHFFGLSSFGGSDLVILNKTLAGFKSLLGGSVWANSIRVIPNDHTSALYEYGVS